MGVIAVALELPVPAVGHVTVSIEDLVDERVSYESEGHRRSSVLPVGLR